MSPKDLNTLCPEVRDGTADLSIRRRALYRSSQGWPTFSHNKKRGLADIQVGSIMALCEIVTGTG